MMIQIIPIMKRMSEFFDDLKIGDHKGIIIGVIIGIIVVIAFIMIDTGIIGNYKNKFFKQYI